LEYKVLRCASSSTGNGGSILEAVQFGYTEEATSFDLVYQQGENDYSVFPGTHIYM